MDNLGLFCQFPMASHTAGSLCHALPSLGEEWAQVVTCFQVTPISLASDPPRW